MVLIFHSNRKMYCIDKRSIIIYLILQDNFGRISIFANQSLSVFLHSNNRIDNSIYAVQEEVLLFT